MPDNKAQLIHDLNNLTVKIKSISNLLLDDEDSGIDLSQMKSDGDSCVEQLQSLWQQIKNFDNKE